jgi:HlyD family secretion protein
LVRRLHRDRSSLQESTVTAIPLTVSHPGAAPLRSLEAYLVPHVIDVTAGAHGRVSTVFFGACQVVRCEQTVATCEPLGPRRQRERGTFSLKAPVTGLVTRRWVSPGDRVVRSSPIVSIASSANVLVVAKFPAGSSVTLGGSSASVLLDGSARAALPASIITVVEAPEWVPGDGAPDARPTRVVLLLPCAPAEVLSPGTPVRVEIRP